MRARAAATRLRMLRGPELRFLVGAWLLAAPMSAALALAGFGSMTRALRHVGCRRSAGGPPIDVERAEDLVRRAFRWSLARWSTARGGCLPRSAVQFTLHAMRGDRVRWVVGVPRAPLRSREPFEAHAWVETADHPRWRSTHAPLFELASG